jgi:hypothetical protein
MHDEQKGSFVDWFHQNVIGTGVHSLPYEILIVLFEQKQDWPLWVNLPHGSYQCDAFDLRLVSITNDGFILNRPDPLQRRERGIYRLYVHVTKLEAQCRSQCVEENRIVIDDENAGYAYGPIPKR